MSVLNSSQIDALSALGFKRWTKDGMDRMYIDAFDLGLRVFYDEKIQPKEASMNDVVIPLTQGLRLREAKTYLGENMQVVYWIKQPNEHHDAVQTTGAPISHTDFPGTILSLIGGDYSQYGTSIFDWHDGDKRERSCSVVSRDVDMYPLVSCYSDLGLGSHNYWRTYTYTGTGKDLMKKNKSGSYKYEPLAQSFN